MEGPSEVPENGSYNAYAADFERDSDRDFSDSTADPYFDHLPYICVDNDQHREVSWTANLSLPMFFVDLILLAVRKAHAVFDRLAAGTRVGALEVALKTTNEHTRVLKPQPASKEAESSASWRKLTA